MPNEKFVFPLYHKDFSDSVTSWSDEEVGAYMRLLIHQWSNGCIPKEMNRLRRISDSVEKNWLLIKTKFTIETEHGFQNPRLEEIRLEKQRFSEKQSANGSMGGRGNKSEKPKESQTITQPKSQKKALLRSRSNTVEEGISNLGKSENLLLVVPEKKHELQNFVETLVEVTKLKNQLSFGEAEFLVNVYGMEVVKEVLQAMENHKDLLKKYKSVYLTCNNWCKRRKENSTGKEGAKSWLK